MLLVRVSLRLGTPTYIQIRVVDVTLSEQALHEKLRLSGLHWSRPEEGRLRVRATLQPQPPISVAKQPILPTEQLLCKVCLQQSSHRLRFVKQLQVQPGDWLSHRGLGLIGGVLLIRPSLFEPERVVCMCWQVQA